MSTQDDPEYVDEKVCEERHKRVDEKLDCYERDIEKINTKITATLVFVIIMLVTLIIDLVKTGFKL